MFISQYYNDTTNAISFTRQQASDFAKNIADDFNPIHNVDAKRFCVPGDLLFSLVLSKYGLSQTMHFSFSGMVTDSVELKLPESSAYLSIKDDNNKEYLSIKQNGEKSSNATLIENLIRQYVAFSGHTFPHILLPLLKEQDVMINPERPMVIYESMLIELMRFDLNDVKLIHDTEKTKLETNGKRGSICLAFNLLSGDELIGRGEKHMLLSGLKPYLQSSVDELVHTYNAGKASYKR